MKSAIVVVGAAVAGLMSSGCERTPADLVIETIVDVEGEAVGAPFFPGEAVSSVDYVIENRGGAPAGDVVLTFAELACVHHVVDGDTLPGSLEGGGSAAVAVEVTTEAGCEGLHIVDWFLTWSVDPSGDASGDETRGTFDYNVTD